VSGNEKARLWVRSFWDGLEYQRFLSEAYRLSDPGVSMLDAMLAKHEPISLILGTQLPAVAKPIIQQSVCKFE
jgi:hypothetical protein